jgi:pyruvate kinase
MENKVKTKIICTIGPSTWDPNVLKELINHGMTVARINASFADADEIKRVTKLIRSLSDKVAVMLDLKGHKIRISDFGDPREVRAGDELILDTNPHTEHIGVSYENLHKDISVGAKILIDDGKIHLTVTKVEGTKIYTKVLNSGLLKRLKTLNVPGTYLSFDPLTEKDKQDIQAGIEAGVDFIAGSFVRDVNDVNAIKERIIGTNIEIIAKIEDPLGVKNFDSILQNVYGIMIARGDLGVELPYEEIPLLQKEFIKKCRSVGKPVIVATHMLESMTANPAPTRAEVNDVANAIFDGADAIMTSAETSTGQYPIEAVRIMQKVASFIELHTKYEEYQTTNDKISFYNQKNFDDADRAITIAKAGAQACETMNIQSVIVFSKTGFTARILRQFNIKQPIYAFTLSEDWARKLALSKGIYAYTIPSLSQNRDEAIQQVINHAKSIGIIKSGDLIAIAIGSQIFAGVNTSTLDLLRVA